MRPKKKASMKDIAEKVGLSVNTVSQALSKKPGVNSQTRERILETAKLLGYEYETPLRSILNGAKSGTVGLIITDNSNPFFAQVVKGAQNTLWQNGYSMILCNTNEDYARESGAIQTLLEKKVDGVIITPTQSGDEAISLFEESGVPVVLMGRHFLNRRIPNVLCNDAGGAFKATEHLLRLGHTRILFINAPAYISSARERQEGYLDAIKQNGFEADPSLIRVCEPNMESVYNEMKSIMLEKLYFTAIFTYNDLMMLGVIRLFQEAGVSVPDDYSLVGFDDIDFVSLLKPSLTTVCIDKYGMGAKSAEVLLSLIQGRKLQSEMLVMPTKLMVRGSTEKCHA
ncbi:LacI family DNA-binding transcriptional regulator [Treponema sp.]